jgi:hypothetical protein
MRRKAAETGKINELQWHSLGKEKQCISLIVTNNMTTK